MQCTLIPVKPMFMTYGERRKEKGMVKRITATLLTIVAVISVSVAVLASTGEEYPVDITPSWVGKHNG